MWILPRNSRALSDYKFAITMTFLTHLSVCTCCVKSRRNTHPASRIGPGHRQRFAGWPCWTGFRSQKTICVKTFVSGYWEDGVRPSLGAIWPVFGGQIGGCARLIIAATGRMSVSTKAATQVEVAICEACSWLPLGSSNQTLLREISYLRLWMLQTVAGCRQL